MTDLSTLNKYFKKYKFLFLLGIFFVILTNYFRILAPQLTGFVINEIVSTLKNNPNANALHPIKHGGYDYFVTIIISWFSQKSFTQKIFFTGIILFSVAIISGFFMFLMRQTIIVMSRHIEFDQKNEIYNHYQKLDTNFYKTHSTGDLMNRISEDVSRVRMYTGPAIMYFINLAAIIGFSLYFMLKADVKLTLVALCPLPLLALAIYFVNSIINNKSEKIQSKLSDLTTNAQESYAGIRVIKSFVQEKAMQAFFNTNSNEYKQNALSLAKTEAIYFPTMGLLIGLSTLITIMVGGLDVIHGTKQIGIIVEFVMYIQMLTFPVSAIGWTASMTQRAAASQKRINEFLEIEPAIKNNEHLIPLQLDGNIDIQNIDFTYPHTNINAIKNFSLSIKKGEKIVIIGKTGSGKSTIAQLLLRMYDVQKGNILYNNVDIKNLDINSLRSQISYVPQDVFLFSDTIKNNISFGESNATDEMIFKAAKQACIFDEINKFEEKFDTILGERGVTLSGGQKQRISIARALIKNPQIVLFDDCLSAVDARTEHEILSNLNQYLTGKTAIIITHRIFSLFDFDKIILLDNGEIKEVGTHNELMQNKNMYYEMYVNQQKNDVL